MTIMTATIEDILTLIRPPDYHQRLDDVCDIYHWGKTNNPEAVSRIALSTTFNGKHPFCLETDDGVLSYDARFIEAFFRDKKLQHKYKIELKDVSS